MRYLILVLSLSLPWPAVAQAPVCWENAQGVTECGNHPPPGVQTRQVRAPKPATQTQADVAEAFAEADLDGEEESRRAILLKHCELARETLAAYERSEFLYERDETGNRRLLDEAETAEVKAAARRDVEARCAEFPETAP